ncbi:hypothetical protein BU16DRAFT_468421 [Lophium mytilinum]|uniref:CID domain-containing protein n=1 Tax=Lophium mytilinum TaxID=390894 RepID=A0A6A6QKA0_9PEZI|nr:hypothetical protein BU16DRAFT_468421 [Lophium mytilinum]
MSLPSAEVAADFKDALQDLKINSRPEISNLTIIAKENTEHAQGISRELEKHIQTTRPEWKLPALYVLDSIVKNVGTPYTLFLGRNLYSTFMSAYAIVDASTRKAMEGLLKTWKQPVPESVDPRPVFSADVTRDIESALIKYRTVAIQQQALSQKQALQHAIPPRPPVGAPWRHTPSPSQTAARYTPTNDPRRQQLPLRDQFPPAPTPPPNHFPPPQQQRSFLPDMQPSIDLNKLNIDLDMLINTTKMEWASNPGDSHIQQKLKALIDLQTILKSQQLPPDQIRMIQQQIIQLSPAPAPTPPVSIAPPPYVTSIPPHMPGTSSWEAGGPVMGFHPPPSVRTPQPAIPPPGFDPAWLSSLLTSSTPTPFVSAPPSFPPPALPPPAAPSLAQLLQQYAPPPTPVAPPQPTPIGSADWLLQALNTHKLLPGTPSNGNDVELTTASIAKKSRPHLISKLYEALPNQCVTCGRRFESSPKGKEMKARHMDWHFKVKDPDVAKRGVHRDWYIGERDWIEFREEDEAAPAPVSNGTSAGGPAAAKKEAKDQYIHVPTDAALVHAPCPICQEKFEPQWLVEANDFVWMDAIKVNEKVYHATCWEEYSRGSGLGGGRGTPDSILGKRKAEVSSNGLYKKARTDL